MTVDGSIEVTTTRETEVSLAGIVPGDTINKTINIKPDSTAESLMRVKIQPNWEGVESPNISNIKIVYADNAVKEELNSSENNYWYKYGDYIYYIGTQIAGAGDTQEVASAQGVSFRRAKIRRKYLSH